MSNLPFFAQDTLPSLPQVPSSHPTAPMNPDLRALTNMSIDDLINLKVTSASDKEQKLSDVSTALSVITSQEIERSGATTIPDLLRYTPGVQVSSINNGQQSVGIRGFGGAQSFNLLVLVDGMSVFGPIYGGVIWEDQHMMLENIDRVEVIRGPGATIWGANAVNGVINITTKDAKDTQGGYASTVYGTKESGSGNFRYGFHPAQDLDVRFYGMYQQLDPSTPFQGTQRFDNFSTGSGGVRADYRPSPDDHFRLSGDASTNRSGDVFNFGTPDQTFFPITPVFQYVTDQENANFIYEHQVETDNVVTLQSYYNHVVSTNVPAGVYLSAGYQTADAQIRQTLPLQLLSIPQELTYGAEYRLVSTEVDPSNFGFKHNEAPQTFSVFAQTDLHLLPDSLTLTAGLRYDHSSYAGHEFQPTVRLLGKINQRNSLWIAASRALGDPYLVESDSKGALIDTNISQPEILNEAEVGYRFQSLDALSFEVTAFANNYTHVIDAYNSDLSPELYGRQSDNVQVVGLEPSFRAQIQPWWQINGSYSYCNYRLKQGPLLPGATNLVSNLNLFNIQNTSSLHSAFDLPQHIDLDLGVRYAERTTISSGYTVLDVRVGWKPVPNWDFSVVGRNLLMANHLENSGGFNNGAYVGPEVYGKIAYKF